MGGTTHTGSCTQKMLLLVFFSFLAFVLTAQDLERLDWDRPVRLTSGLGLQTTFYRVSEIPYRRQPFNWSLSGTPVLHIYGLSLPFSFYVSNQQLGFQQPFNQFGISPTYKWATVHLGYSSVRFSDYTLAGRRFLGVGTELNPGKLRLGFIYGRFQKAVEQDSIVRATPETYLGGVPNGAFARKGYAAKLGFGTERSYVDLIYMQAADDSTSLVTPLSLEELKPEKNTAVGIRHRIGSKSGVYWESDAALSFYTRDVNGEPADSSDIPAFLYRLFNPKLSSQIFYAANTRVGYDSKTVKTLLRYRRISRDFRTMGAYYFQTDLEEVAVQLGSSLFKRKVQWRGNLGLQRNNLSENRAHTTRRVIASLYTGVQVSPRLRSDIVYSNFGITQRPQHPWVDSIRIDQVLENWQVSANYAIPSARPQSVMVQFNTQHLAPRDPVALVNEMRAINTTVVYTISLPDLQMNLSLLGQGIWTIQDVGTTRSTGGGATVAKAFVQGKLNTQAGLRIFNTSFAELEGGLTVSADGGVNYRITDHWSIATNLRLTSSAGSGQHPGQKFNETLITLNSQFQF